MAFFEKWFSKKEKKTTQQTVADEKANEKPAPAPVPAPAQKKDEMRWNLAIGKAMEYVADKMKKQLEENNRLGKSGIFMELEGSQNVGLLAVEQSAREPEKKVLSVRAVRKGTDYSIMHYIKTGSMEEIIAYLENGENVQELYQSLTQLSAALDDRF